MADLSSGSKTPNSISNKFKSFISSFFNSIGLVFTYDNQKAAKVLLGIAILIEIAVATLGIYLGILLMKEGRTGLSDLAMEMSKSELELSSLQNNFIILIYSIIALVELARVPLIISIYRGNSSTWKILGSMIVAILMLVAFISMTIGQIKISSLRDTNIQIIDTEISGLQDNVALSKSELIDLQFLTRETIDAAYKIEISTIDVNLNNQTSPFKDEKDRIEIQKISSSDNEKRELENLERSLLKIENSRDDEISNVINNANLRIENIRKSRDENIARLEGNINTEVERRNINQSLLGNTSSGIMSSSGDKKTNQSEIEDANVKIDGYENQIIEIQAIADDDIKIVEADRDRQLSDIKNLHSVEISNMEQNIAVKQNEINEIIKQSSEALDIRLIQISEDIREIQDEAQREREEARKLYDNKLIDYDKRQIEIEEKKSLVIELNKQINDLKADKEVKTNTKLVYLLATHFSFLDACEGAETAGDVTPACRKTTENIWFGMIAAIVAIAGSAVAIGSEILRTADTRFKAKRKPIRGVIVKIFKYTFRPRVRYVEKIVEKIIEVPKIVKEEKIIFKEVPKEIIKKEIIHVPVPTVRDTLIKDKK